MKHEETLIFLEQAAEGLSIQVGYDDLKKGEVNTHGGAFVLKGLKRILIHKHLSPREKAETLAEILLDMGRGEGMVISEDVISRAEAVLGSAVPKAAEKTAHEPHAS
ncbi:MAG: hypothetical protein OEV59_03655 [Deltaproteobacteria bacterium]|nr:hypothetical protein [Deltaproteobacteria bacterium]